MEVSQKIENNCLNCKFYLQHYLRSGVKFKRVKCGHCTASIRKLKSPILCDKWEEVTVSDKKKYESVKKMLEEMAKNLNYISEFLQTEENENIL